MKCVFVQGKGDPGMSGDDVSLPACNPPAIRLRMLLSGHRPAWPAAHRPPASVDSEVEA